tara:strand:+ start:4966 stop:5151 length:186 start_codon:yes stop_codon:yes gene_type:complete
MSLIELIIILLITLGIVDKRKLQRFYETFKNIQNGPKREIIGDESLEQEWTWIDRTENEDE